MVTASKVMLLSWGYKLKKQTLYTRTHHPTYYKSISKILSMKVFCLYNCVGKE